VIAANASLVAAETPSPRPEDPIAAAKRDYEAIQASGAEADQVAPGRVRQSLPSIELATEGPLLVTPIQRARKSEAIDRKTGAAHSKNWLLDAMDATSRDLTKPGNRKSADLERDGESLIDHSWLTGSGRTETDHRVGRGLRSAPGSAAHSPDALLRADVSNPLSQYMSTWMTARDFELLQSKPNSAAGQGTASFLSSTAANGSPVHPMPGAQVMPGDEESVFDFTGLPIGSKSVNPYIDGLVTPPALLPPAARAGSNLVPPPNLMPPLQNESPVLKSLPDLKSKPSTIEQLKSQDDARYFKQLKRF
jgi:hypothetical protein